jgi:2,4-dienoyl-CoA reductase-like NADH-dependent reductase (Old Yellow Enzyme family)
MEERKNSVVSIFNTHTEAEEAIRELQRSGFDMKKLSIVGKDYHAEEHVVGYYNTGDRVKYETSLKSNKFLVVAHGSIEEVDKARGILDATSATETAVHHSE